MQTCKQARKERKKKKKRKRKDKEKKKQKKVKRRKGIWFLPSLPYFFFISSSSFFLWNLQDVQQTALLIGKTQGHAAKLNNKLLVDFVCTGSCPIHLLQAQKTKNRIRLPCLPFFSFFFPFFFLFFLFLVFFGLFWRFTMASLAAALEPGGASICVETLKAAVALEPVG